MNHVETFLAPKLTITNPWQLKVSDFDCSLLSLFLKNGAPIKLKDGIEPEKATYDDVEMTGEMIRTISDKPGVRFEWRW